MIELRRIVYGIVGTYTLNEQMKHIWQENDIEIIE